MALVGMVATPKFRWHPRGLQSETSPGSSLALQPPPHHRHGNPGSAGAQNTVFANRNGLPSAVGKQSIRQLANTSPPLREISLARGGSR
jgi:hypothetical protein